MCRLLLDWGAAPNRADEDREGRPDVVSDSALHIACHHGHGDVVQLLLARGANYKLAVESSLDAKIFKQSPLCLAKKHGNDVVEAMLAFEPLKRSLDRRTCSYCAAARKLFEPPLQICRRCRTRYCSRACQELAWSQGHRVMCAAILHEFQGLYALGPWEEPTAVESENHLTVLRDIRNKYATHERALRANHERLAT